MTPTGPAPALGGPSLEQQQQMGKLKAMAPRLGSMPAKVRAAPKTAEGFYSSSEWRRLLARIKRERGNFCERCGVDGGKQRLIGDHKVERKDGGADLDPDNVELLCAKRCHPAKTAQARARRADGATA